MTRRVIGLVLVNTYPTGYFDGATPTNIGGVGIVLLISSSHFFHAKMGCGKITNTIAELLVVWTLLSFYAYIGNPMVLVFGDS